MDEIVPLHEPARESARVLIDVIADAGYRLRNAPGEPGDTPRFTTDLPAASGELTAEGVAIVAVTIAARVPGTYSRDAAASVLAIVSSGTHANATGHALRELLNSGSYVDA